MSRKDINVIILHKRIKSRDVVFDELSSWHVESKTLQVEEFEESQIQERRDKPQESIELSGPSISSPSTPAKEVIGLGIEDK